MAKYLRGKKKIRLLSLGTGYNEDVDKKMSDGDQFTKSDSLSNVANSDFMMNYESITSDQVMKSLLSSSDYYRANIPTKATLDSTDEKDIKMMEQDGTKMYEQHKDQI